MVFLMSLENEEPSQPFLPWGYSLYSAVIIRGIAEQEPA